METIFITSVKKSPIPDDRLTASEKKIKNNFKVILRRGYQ